MRLIAGLGGLFWGSQEGKRKVHQVSWDKICSPKHQGGLGLRTARSLNLAFMIKLAWKILNNKDELWVKVLQGKYFHQREGRILGMKSSNHSSLWRGICKGFPMMQQATVWSIRDGRTTEFWNHPWIDHETILGEHCLRELTEEERYMTVSEMANDRGEWDWSRLHDVLPNEFICCIAGMETPAQDLGEDTTIWGLESDGRFIFKSAYLLAANEIGKEALPDWKELWRWKGPSRVKHFLWLVLYNRLLTNHERAKRNMTADSFCKACEGEDLRIFKQWMMDNLKKEEGGIEFGIACWMIWKQRNEEVMEGKKYSEAALICRICSWVNVYQQANKNDAKCLLQPQTQHNSTAIAWKPPREGWLIRDHLG
ncbi:unnamed protein product [Linum tenue]|uniref:Reverse transcriptase zinc-binding domain-containing protein n=1 Tax=Linum tenue TaxID=586396 RepID=A0AAV0S4J5_9ROSI|nr:unnamed protein product [Linum tenue]